MKSETKWTTLVIMFIAAGIYKAWLKDAIIHDSYNPAKTTVLGVGIGFPLLIGIVVAVTVWLYMKWKD
jgi:ribose/xylose/arabinose/galactoside ABC-type transport system permease subunit